MHVLTEEPFEYCSKFNIFSPHEFNEPFFGLKVLSFGCVGVAAGDFVDDPETSMAVLAFEPSLSPFFPAGFFFFVGACIVPPI